MSGNDEPGPSVDRLAALLAERRRYELAHELAADMPVWPFHVPYTLTMHRRHGDTNRPGNTSFASEIIVMSGHTATHVDAIGHFSRDGLLHDGSTTREAESPSGLKALDAAAIPPVLARGVLLDVAAVRGVEVMQPGEPIGAQDLSEAAERAGVSLEEGDVVLVRTGWARHWGDRDRFNGQLGGYPGLDTEGAQWILDHGPHSVGSDTPAFEVAPPTGGSVHAMFLVDAGVYIVENLNLEALAQAEVREFLFIMLSLRIRGGTGSPIRPVAIA